MISLIKYEIRSIFFTWPVLYWLFTVRSQKGLYLCKRKRNIMYKENLKNQSGFFFIRFIVYIDDIHISISIKFCSHLFTALWVGLRSPTRVGKTLPLKKGGVLGKILNCILCWSTSSGSMGCVESSLHYHYSQVNSGVVITVRFPSMDRIELFKNCSYLIGIL